MAAESVEERGDLGGSGGSTVAGGERDSEEGHRADEDEEVGPLGSVSVCMCELDGPRIADELEEESVVVVDGDEEVCEECSGVEDTWEGWEHEEEEDA